MSRPAWATCRNKGTPHCTCYHPSPAELARVAAIGRRTLGLWRHPRLGRLVEALRVGLPNPVAVVREWRRLGRLLTFLD